MHEGNPFVLIVNNILSKEECDALINKSEEQQFELALINIGNGKQTKLTEIRNNDRTYIDDNILAEHIWSRINKVLPNTIEPRLHYCRSNGILGIDSSAGNDDDDDNDDEGNDTWKAVGLNERLRVLRYDPGTYFAPHEDGAYVRTDKKHPQYGDRSFITAQIYLNEHFVGGATRMLNPRSHDESEGIDVTPKTGSILLFHHRIYHEGSILNERRKYTIRTDVMFTKVKK